MNQFRGMEPRISRMNADLKVRIREFRAIRGSFPPGFDSDMGESI